MNLSQELKERGFIYQSSAENLEDILGQKRTVYLGVDPTADSIHVGHLVTYIFVTHLARQGHKIILLVGGATSMIGDPSGKDQERPLLSEKEIAKNADSISGQIRKLTDIKGMETVNNYDWFQKINVLEFLREVGKHFTVNAMLRKDSIASRLESESGISFTEFSYSLLQGYDFYHLNLEKGCDLQVGGSDQWGNIVAGIDLIKRKSGRSVHGITLPLVIDKTTGRKFGKSEGNAVWLDPEKTSPYQFYQFWLNVDDANVIDYLKLYTFLPLEEINRIAEDHQAAPEKRTAQRILAFETTRLVHGEEMAEAVKKVSQIIFGNGGVEGITDSEKDLLLKEAPVCRVSEEEDVVEVLVKSGLAKSKREAREFLSNGAVTKNGEKITDASSRIKGKKGEMMILKRGKKNKSVIYFE